MERDCNHNFIKANKKTHHTFKEFISFVAGGNQRLCALMPDTVTKQEQKEIKRCCISTQYYHWYLFNTIHIFFKLKYVVIVNISFINTHMYNSIFLCKRIKGTTDSLREIAVPCGTNIWYFVVIKLDVTHEIILFLPFISIKTHHIVSLRQ